MIAPTGSMTLGPMKITLVYCGKFTAAQQSQFGTTAAGGLIYRYANESNSVTAATDVSVNFTDGSTVTATNNAGASLPLTEPGQDAPGEVDAVGRLRAEPLIYGYEVMSYSLVMGSGMDPVSYAGRNRPGRPWASPCH